MSEQLQVCNVFILSMDLVSTLTYLIFIIIVIMPKCPGSALQTVIQPSSTSYMRVGDTLELTCSYSDTEFLQIYRCSAENEYEKLTSIRVNSSSIKTSLGPIQLEDAATYRCSYNDNTRTDSITFVSVGYVPSPAKDIYCFSKDHMEMNCSVTLADRDVHSKLPYNVTIEFQSILSAEWRKCPHYDGQTYSCLWRSPALSDSSGIDYLSVFSLVDSYKVRAVVMNILGQSESSLSIEDTKTIVKLSRLFNFSCDVVNSRKAVLSWKLNEYLIIGYIIDFNITFSSKWDYTPKQLQYSNKTIMRTELNGLVPNTKYEVTIRAKSRRVMDYRNWSPSQSCAFYTNKDAPDKNPAHTVGGYYLSGFTTNTSRFNCALLLYVKPVLDKFRNGDLDELYYTVTVNKTGTKAIHPPATTLSLSDPSCWRNGPYNISLRACIESYGCQQQSTLIHIPAFYQDSERVIYPRAKEVVVESYDDQLLRVSWSLLDTSSMDFLIRDVTIFWCRGRREEHVCESDLNWKTLKRKQSFAWINISQYDYRDWMFAVSLTTQAGESGGMAFEECQFPNADNAKQKSVRPTFNILRDDEEDGSKATISLTFGYCDSKFLYGKPEQYEIFYKEIPNEHRIDDCTIGAMLLNMTANLHLREIKLSNLNPQSLYSVCMRIRTHFGTSNISEVRWRKPFTENGTTNADIKWTIPLILFVIILAVVACFWIRQRYLSIDSSIDIPDVYKDNLSVISENEKLENEDIDDDSGMVSKDATSSSSGKRVGTNIVPSRQSSVTRENNTSTAFASKETQQSSCEVPDYCGIDKSETLEDKPLINEQSINPNSKDDNEHHGTGTKFKTGVNSVAVGDAVPVAGSLETNEGGNNGSSTINGYCGVNISEASWTGNTCDSEYRMNNDSQKSHPSSSLHGTAAIKSATLIPLHLPKPYVPQSGMESCRRNLIVCDPPNKCSTESVQSYTKFDHDTYAPRLDSDISNDSISDSNYQLSNMSLLDDVLNTHHSAHTDMQFLTNNIITDNSTHADGSSNHNILQASRPNGDTFPDIAPETSESTDADVSSAESYVIVNSEAAPELVDSEIQSDLGDNIDDDTSNDQCIIQGYVTKCV